MKAGSIAVTAAKSTKPALTSPMMAGGPISIKPGKSDAKWRPFRDKIAKKSSPFYSQGY